MKKNVLELLEEIAGKDPDKLFADDGRDSITYSETVQKARGIGTLLHRDGSGMVCILADKSVGALLFLLGSIYAGRPYGFINPTVPPERIIKMLEVAASDVLYVDSENHIALEREEIKTLPMERYLGNTCTDDAELKRIRDISNAQDPLYGMFTSGTTGVPKLVAVSHEGVLDFIEDFVGTTGITEDAVIANQAPFDFDVSVKDIYSALFIGCSLIILKKEILTNPDELLLFLDQKGVNTLIWAVTALCIASNTNAFTEKVSKKIRKVMFSGEVMPMAYLKKWVNSLPDAEFINLYGPTEVVCNCTYYKLSAEDEELDRIPIGKPFPKRNVYLVDEDGNLITGTEQTGEICVGGKTLALGYLNNQTETEKCFTKMKCSDGNEDFIYKTGDLGYYGKNDQLYFSGRKDFQIKRMGHRIELEEIDRRLMDLDEVEFSCSVYDENTQKLCTFFTGTGEPGPLRRELRRSIPTYMLPNRMIHIEQMPVNKNGKIDRSGLKSKYARHFQ